MENKYTFRRPRRGSTDTKANYGNTAIYTAIKTILAFGLWALLRPYIFPNFDPLSYWNMMTGSILNNAATLALPVTIYAIFNGITTWFSKDSREGTIYSEGIVFKGIISLFAGVWEELSHRGVYIWYGLIIVFLTDYTFKYTFALCLLIIVLELLFSNITACIIAVIASIGIWLYASGFAHPINAFNGFILGLYQWAVADTVRVTIVYMLIISLAVWEFSDQLHKNYRSLSDIMTGKELLLGMLSLLIWAVYAMPKGIATLSDLPIIPTGADHNTYLLFVGAVMWSNAKFKEGHKYQGTIGQLNSHIFAFYMIYIAFTFGLVYAIALHFTYDFLLLSSENIIYVIKRRVNAGN